MNRGLIFTDRHLQRPDDVGMVFMVLMLGGLKDVDVNDLGLIYEYVSAAGPRSCNGYPCFFSCRMLNKQDASKLFVYYDRLKAAEEDALKPIDTPKEVRCPST